MHRSSCRELIQWGRCDGGRGGGDKDEEDDVEGVDEDDEDDEEGMDEDEEDGEEGVDEDDGVRAGLRADMPLCLGHEVAGQPHHTLEV